MKAVKKFKRAIAIFMAVCMLLSLATVVSAADNRNNKTNIEIVFDGDIDKEKAQLIIDIINGVENPSPRFNPLCLLSHSLAETSMLINTHYVYATSPRCVSEIYRVKYCTRSSCNYLTYTLISSIRIPCCP